MMNASDFTTIIYQTTAFTTGSYPRIGLLVKSLLESFADNFPADPIVLPIPENAPREIPRLILKNGDSSRIFQLSSARIDVSFRAEQGLDISTGDNLALQFLDHLDKKFQVRYGRLSLVVIRAFKTAHPGITLAHHFCKSKWVETKALDRSQAFEIHAYRRYRVNEMFPNINSWIRHKAGDHIFSGIAPITGIIIEQDLNTAHEEESSADFSEEMREQFYRVMSVEANKILSNYYPEN